MNQQLKINATLEETCIQANDDILDNNKGEIMCPDEATTCDRFKNVDVEDAILVESVDNTENYCNDQTNTDGKTLVTEEVCEQYAEELTDNNTEEVKSVVNRASISELPVDQTPAPWYSMTSNGPVLARKKLAVYLAKTVPGFFYKGKFHLYEDGVYVRYEEEEKAEGFIQDCLDDETADNKQIKEVLKFWKRTKTIREKEINPNPNILNLKNGLLDIMTMELTPHTPEYISTIRIHANYCPVAKAPVCQEFLDTVLPDKNQQKLLWEIFGYFLSTSTAAQKMFILVGPGRTGKSTTLGILRDLLGKENCSSVDLQNIDKPYMAHRLVGKLANIAGDLPLGRFDNTGTIKNIVGEDTITVRDIYKQPYDVKISARLIASCNEIPASVNDLSSAWFERFCILQFKNVIPTEKRDARLAGKLREEMDGILLLALEGLRSLVTETETKLSYAFSTTNDNRELLEEYRRNSNPIIEFAEEYLEAGEYRTSNKNILKAYDMYCCQEGITYNEKLGIKAIKPLLMEWNPALGEYKSGGRGLVGIRLKPEIQKAVDKADSAQDLGPEAA